MAALCYIFTGTCTWLRNLPVTTNSFRNISGNTSSAESPTNHILARNEAELVSPSKVRLSTIQTMSYSITPTYPLEEASSSVRALQNRRGQTHLFLISSTVPKGPHVTHGDAERERFVGSAWPRAKPERTIRPGSATQDKNTMHEASFGFESNHS